MEHKLIVATLSTLCGINIGLYFQSVSAGAASIIAFLVIDVILNKE